MKNIKELALFIQENLSSAEGYERGETDVLWKKKDNFDFGHDGIKGLHINHKGEINDCLSYEMAKDILDFIEVR